VGQRLGAAARPPVTASRAGSPMARTTETSAPEINAGHTCYVAILASRPVAAAASSSSAARARSPGPSRASSIRA